MNLFRNDPFFSGNDMLFDDFNYQRALPFSNRRVHGDNDYSSSRSNRNRDLMSRGNNDDDLFSNPFAMMQNMMGNMRNVMANMETRMSDPQMGANGVSFSSSTVYKMDNSSGNGQPRIFQATSERLRGPEGLERTRKAVRDTGRNLEKMEIAHRLGERGHRILRERDPSTGQLIENKEFEHIDPNDELAFQDEWNQKSRNYGNLNNALYDTRTNYVPIGSSQNRSKSMDRGSSQLAIDQPFDDNNRDTSKKRSQQKYRPKK
ncbi:unnamed protein product [Didymodactylos carnosus]|uniref:Myeloid leukemia factor n=1 Tax=Didymodactylos carnosus TaxID=1234261 RepID=A0A813YCX3_9BILA|nr:unnamed protein product [Didymodactylos carnosus]CAF1059481.1 unnamed protein product [Didymodactylos carnosus]CAF3668351.1 unnamed protein product [Didymodactylos carnosus]CAF3825202.1 unnamed protein product [Didymodactylos carnosus]